MPTVVTVSLFFFFSRTPFCLSFAYRHSHRVDFPWSLQHILPFWAGAEHHDFHHMAFTNNFATSFRWCDRLGGTDTKYLEYRKRMDAAKGSKATKEEQAELEKKLMADAEAEGLVAEAKVVSTSLKALLTS